MTRQIKSRIAVVHDWIVTYAGAEIVLRNILNLLKKKRCVLSYKRYKQPSPK